MGAVIEMNDKAVLGLANDPTIWISTGGSRHSKTWKNQEIKWSVLLGRLQTPTRTQETQAEYFRMPADQQGSIKDVGGFVGGTLKGGRRVKANAGERYLLTFDMDKAPVGFCDTMRIDADYAWMVYSTHKHTPDVPRLRLVVPLTRPVTPDEYEAAMRMMASDIGMAYMDRTTFEPTRLMYWPSVSRDAEYVFEYADGPSVDPDELLARYGAGEAWRDIASWPLCPDEMKAERPRANKIEDPTAKKGLVGVFCRTYTITEAIAKFLPEVYLATEKDDRYTYADGTTSGGLVIYDDDHACYSHHSTDPAGGKDLNAFDLVRVHLYGDQDPAETGKAVTALPSYKAMEKLILQDEECRMLRLKEQAADFDDDEDLGDEDLEAWKKKLTQNKNGIEPTYQNAYLIISHEPMIAGIQLNDLTGAIECRGSMPWKRNSIYWDNTDSTMLYSWIATYKDYRVAFTQTHFDTALKAVAGDHRYNPLHDFVCSLPEWDGVPRLDTMLVDYLDAEDTPYTRAVTRKTFCGAMARALEPGCKYDYMLVLDGPEGIGKSSIFRILGGEFFSDSLKLTDVRSKDAAEKIQGNWILEAPELSGRSKTDVDEFKGFITQQSDRFRPAYGKIVERRLRTAIIVGTTNSTTGFLRDLTGNRRFWPVIVKGKGRLDVLQMTEETRCQILAEAKHYYEEGEELFLSPELEAVARMKQREQLEASDREGDIVDFLEEWLPSNFYDLPVESRENYFRCERDEGSAGPDPIKRTIVTAKEICEECFMGQWPRTKAETNELASIMKKLGWATEKHRVPGRYKNPTRVYVRGGDAGQE